MANGNIFSVNMEKFESMRNMRLSAYVGGEANKNCATKIRANFIERPKCNLRNFDVHLYKIYDQRCIHIGIVGDFWANPFLPTKFICLSYHTLLNFYQKAEFSIIASAMVTGDGNRRKELGLECFHIKYIVFTIYMSDIIFDELLHAYTNSILLSESMSLCVFGCVGD